ncbi:MAG: heavy metal-binding domain-containing protein, partial [Bacteroidota bacterium]
MKHTYTITGMSCDGCRSKVEKTLNAIDGIHATVTLDPPIATITMDEHLPTAQLQEVLTEAGNYTIAMNNATDSHQATEKPIEKSCCSSNKQQEKPTVILPTNAQGKYYCPMHCEGEKVYDKPGSCPVCGMNLEKVPELSA